MNGGDRAHPARVSWPMVPDEETRDLNEETGEATSSMNRRVRPRRIRRIRAVRPTRRLRYLTAVLSLWFGIGLPAPEVYAGWWGLPDGLPDSGLEANREQQPSREASDASADRDSRPGDSGADEDSVEASEPRVEPTAESDAIEGRSPDGAQSGLPDGVRPDVMPALSERSGPERSGRGWEPKAPESEDVEDVESAYFAFASEQTEAPDRPAGWAVGRTPRVFSRSEQLATRIGGWADASYQDNDTDASSSFNVNHFNLYFDTRYGKTWQAFLEVEFENESGVRGFEEEREYEVEQAYLRWMPSDRIGVRVGQFNTPFGIWTPLHWAILMDTITEPIHEGTRVTPEQQVGLEVAGRIFLDEWLQPGSELRYSVYAGYGDDTELFSESGSDGVSLGSDLNFRFRESTLFGVSMYRQTREQESLEDRSELGYMIYGEAQPLDPLTLRFEVFRQYRDRHVTPALSRTINIGYVKARWDFTDRVYLNYRYNYGDDEGEGASDERRTHTVTLGVRPRADLRLKLEYATNKFQDSTRRDFNYWGISVGVLF